MTKRWIILVVFTLLFVVVISLALADGTETLGPPSITIASGNGMVTAGIGMAKIEPPEVGQIVISVPNGAAVNQVLLYWEGQMEIGEPGDDTITVNGTEVTGQSIGGPTLEWNGFDSQAFRADITDLGLVASGETTLTLGGLNFSHVNDGAGVLVLYQEDARPDADIGLVDGLDLAFQGWPEDDSRHATKAQTFTFAAADEARAAQLSLFVGSVVGDVSGRGDPRPNSIEVTTGGVTETFTDQLGSADGEEWDAWDNIAEEIKITIPPGADSLTVQLFSRDDNDTGYLPASLNWVTAALLVAPPSSDLEVSKTCTPAVFVGDEIAYEITITNTGEVDLTGVEVNDSILGMVAEIDNLAPEESRTLSETMIAAEAGVITNTVQATGTNASTSETVESNVAECMTTVYELEVTKDVQPSLTRRYKWEINKTVNGQKSIDLTLLPGQVPTPAYNVVVDLADPPYADSGWVVSGNIRIANPAPMTAYLSAVTDVIPDFYLYLPVIAKGADLQSLAAVQDQHNNTIPPGISVPVDCPSLTVPAGETLVCTYGPVDLSSGLTRPNYAFAALKNTVGGDFSGTTLFSGMAQIDFSSAEIEWLDQEVTVDDQREGEDNVRVLGTANVNESLPKTFAYEKPPLPSFTIEECMDVGDDGDGTDGFMKHIPNTATFTTNDTGSTGSSDAEVNLTCIISTSVGFEDLPLAGDNDWDYNDAFFEVSFDPTFSDSNDLEKITFEFTQTVNWSVNTHEFHIRPDVFNCNGTYTLTRSDEAHGVEEEEGTYTRGQDLTIFDDTKLDKPDYPDMENPRCDMPPVATMKNPPPPAPTKTNTATLEINFDVTSPGACALDWSKYAQYDPFGTFNGEGLFYVPSLVVKNRCDQQEEWPRGWYTIKPISGPVPEPRIVGVPDTWIWAKENQCLWKVYPDITPADPDKGPPLFQKGIDEFWWQNYIGPNDDYCPPFDN